MRVTDFRYFFFSSRRRHTRWNCDWSSDVCSSDLTGEEQIAELEELRQPTLSLDAPSGGETRRLSDIIPDVAANPAATLTRLFRQRADLAAVLDDLAPNERTVLRRRFGLEGDEPETLETIGRRLGLSRERVRQIEGGGLRKLRALLAARGVDASDVL